MKNILKSLGLKVKLPILASIDNGRAIDIGNNWSVGHRTCHVEVKQNFLWELKEAGIVGFQWVSTASNEEDMFTKNWWGQNITSMLQGCVDTINSTALCKMKRVMSKGGCQEPWSAHN